MNPEFKKQLLRLVSVNARMSVEDMAERLAVKSADVVAALQELEEANEIIGYCA